MFHQKIKNLVCIAYNACMHTYMVYGVWCMVYDVCICMYRSIHVSVHEHVSPPCITTRSRVQTRHENTSITRTPTPHNHKYTITRTHYVTTNTPTSTPTPHDHTIDTTLTVTNTSLKTRALCCVCPWLPPGVT